jgi:hypothetical protein
MKPTDHQTRARASAALTRPGKTSIVKLRPFEREVRKVAAISVGSWHAQQVAGFIASMLEENGDKKAAALLFSDFDRTAQSFFTL